MERKKNEGGNRENAEERFAILTHVPIIRLNECDSFECQKRVFFALISLANVDFRFVYRPGIDPT